MENKIAEKISKRKDSIVRQSITYWLWFKKKILENKTMRKWFQSKPELDRPSFAQHVKSKFNPNKFPASVQRSTPRKSEFITDCWNYYRSLLLSSLPYKVHDTKFGLGIWVKESFDSSLLWGTLIRLDDNTFQAFTKEKYPSLFSSKGIGYTMVGPLALVNHSCTSELGFSSEKLVLEVNEIRVYIKPRVNLEKGKEVLVRYCDKEELWFHCKC